MMRKMCFMLPTLLLTLPLCAEQNSERVDLFGRIHSRSDAAMLNESIASEQARAKAKSRSKYGLELRPKISNNEVGVGLRIYLPDNWKRSRLREQLILVAESEQLRVSALEWQDLIKVYHKFCDYRMHQKQVVLFKAEQERLEPYLKKANDYVNKNRLAVTDRAKIYRLYLDLFNRHEKSKSDLLNADKELRLLLGADVDLKTMAHTAMVDMPPKMEFEVLKQQALGNRADYQHFEAQARAFDAAEAVARSEDGFRLKYIQPFYNADYNDGGNTVGLSAAFSLPWGTRNPEFAVYQHQRALSLSSRDHRRYLIENRLKVLLKTAGNSYVQTEHRLSKLNPVIEQLKLDLNQMDTGRLDELRDCMLIRNQILNSTLQDIQIDCSREHLAVDLAGELGKIGNADGRDHSTQ